jgi:CRP/FNR family transcriptional regulator
MIELDQISEFKFSPEIREKLIEYGTLKTYHEGDRILNEHSYIRSIPIVLKGNIRVMRPDEEGKEMLLYYVKPGETCILSFLGAIHHEKCRVNAVAEEETEILFVPVDKVSSLIKEYSEWVDYIFRLYNKRFEELLEVVNALAFKKVDDRILNLLQSKMRLNNNPEITITHQQLADELGTARVVVSRLLKQMETDGLVKLGRNKITLM